MILLVTGDRDWDTPQRIWWALEKIHEKYHVTELVHGGARGADLQAAAWAVGKGIAVSAYPANWRKYNKAAGPLRNQAMLEGSKPDYCVAFHNDLEQSKGTKDMVDRVMQNTLIPCVLVGLTTVERLQ